MNTDEIKKLAKAKGCTSSAQAKDRYVKTPFGHKDEEIFLQIWRVLSDEEAPAHAKSCTCPEEAKKLFGKAFQGSFAKTAFLNRWVELANESAALTASSCDTSSHAESLMRDAPEGSRAKEIFLNRQLELQLEELQAKRRGTTTLKLVWNPRAGVQREERRRSTDRRSL